MIYNFVTVITGLSAILCLLQNLLCRHPVIVATNAAYINIQHDDVTGSSVKNGQAQYEMIRRDSNMPR